MNSLDPTRPESECPGNRPWQPCSTVKSLPAGLRWMAASLISAVSLHAAERPKEPASTLAPAPHVETRPETEVQWRVWSDATLAQARAAGRPIYLFVGSELSELSRATLRQTFANPQTATWMNENFSCLMIDADTRPEVASLAQHFIERVKQRRGLPVHLWLTPDFEPYDGAGYLPPSEEWGQPGFLKSARSALEAWTVDPARARTLAAEARRQMSPLALIGGATDPSVRLDQAAAAWIAAIDPVHGGFGSAPKVPEPEAIRFLLRRGPTGQEAALNAARALVNGAARDAAEGGFYRRTIDEAWKEPYFQKTLADQARISLALFEVANLSGELTLRKAAFEALDFALKFLRRPDGSFAAALDGTRGENAESNRRPHFLQTGPATTGALGLFLSALQSARRTDESRYAAAASAIADTLRRLAASADGTLPRHAGSAALASPADHLAVALGLRALANPKDAALAERLIARVQDTYFDPASGLYQASPPTPSPGIALRVPASGEVPSAEALALIAGVPEATAAQIRRALLTAIEYDVLPPGDTLLALATTTR